MEQINNQRLKCLFKPARWDTRAQCRNTLEPDVILFGANSNELLHSIIDTKLHAVAEGIKLDKGKVEITDEREELFDLYNSAVDIVDYGTNDYTKYEKIIKIVQQAFGYMVFLKRDQDNANIIYVSPMVPINQQHIESQASFLECVRYFEDISSIKTNAYSLPLKSDYGNYQDLDSSNSDQSDHGSK
ncbi:21216_t:CDS:2 [Gigaspora margarita]|uniref:21216_t:CDS:1 n=1 Tax=Gigaspora margarita TaxID=4874 RepID=A0ABN7UEG8_GIGMA|nr:21216_t:CDS:2 [Gigaspora margarita]